MSAPPMTMAVLLPCLLAACGTSPTTRGTFKHSFTFEGADESFWIAAFVDRKESFYLACSVEGLGDVDPRREYSLVYGVKNPEHLSLSRATDDDGRELETSRYLLGPDSGSRSLAAITVALPRGYLQDHRETGFEVTLEGERKGKTSVDVPAAVVDGFLIRCDYEIDRPRGTTERSPAPVSGRRRARAHRPSRIP